jgi:hypothetical protein
LVESPRFDVNQRNGAGETLLHHVVNPDIQMVYVQRRMVKIVKKLLDRGADVGVVDEKGMTALDWARIRAEGSDEVEMKAVVKVLEEAVCRCDVVGAGTKSKGAS